MLRRKRAGPSCDGKPSLFDFGDLAARNKAPSMGIERVSGW